MGGTLKAMKRKPVTVTVHVKGMSGQKVEIITGGRIIHPAPDDGAIGSDDSSLSIVIPRDHVERWVRADVRSPDGRRILIGNPVYVENR
jgi:hypothetical protein